MIDWHSHILPGVDDGSRDIPESLAMLAQLTEQGVDTVVATSHFYADDETVEAFLQRRDRALEALMPCLPQNAPKIIPGAEVYYYPGISRLTQLRQLCLQGSELLLLEMPMCKWSESAVKELEELARQGRLTLILAHVERYMDLQSDQTWRRLRDSGIWMQSNASFFLGFGTKRRALRLLQTGQLQLLGSDCHNVASRPPQIGKAFDVIKKKLGGTFLEEMDAFGKELLEKSKFAII